MDIEQLERIGKYFLPDRELLPDDFEYVLANAPELRRLSGLLSNIVTTRYVYPRDVHYNILDYCGIRAQCSEIEGKPVYYYFSARYRVICCNIKDHEERYLDFAKEKFDPHGDIVSHTVRVGDYSFWLGDPFSYNFLILLLKWSDKKFESREFPLDNSINAEPLLITKELQKEYFLSVDVSSDVPFAVGYGEFSVLDQYYISPKTSIKGGLCFYCMGGYNKPCCGIEKLPAGHICLGFFPSPYPDDSYSSSSHDYLAGISFSRAKEFSIRGNENELTLYIFADNATGQAIKLRLFSKRDYYSVATWLIVALSFSCNFADRYSIIQKYWPACPLLSKGYAKHVIEKGKAEKYVKIIRPFYISIREVLQAYTSVRTDEYNADNPSLEELFEAECVALLDDLSDIGLMLSEIDFLNQLFEANYDYEQFTAIRGRVGPMLLSGPSKLLEEVYLIDLLGTALKKIDQPVAQPLLQFYKLLGEAYIDIADIDDDEKAKEKLRQWLDDQQEYTLKGKKKTTNNNIITISSTIVSSSGKSSTAVSNITSVKGKGDKSANSRAGSLSDIMQELESLVGLDSIKNDVINLISLVKMQQLRKSKGLKSVPVSLHLVFTGNPGTGKTTVARILAQLYKEIGVLKKGQLVEVDRADLIAGYVGQTALKTEKKIEEAIGGILFIDEAYTLAKEGNDFGQEAIDTILKEMEDRRDEFIVIVAGYDEPMQKFINSNPGLKSRFNKYFHFPDYSSDELIEIFKKMLQKYDYSITADAMDVVTRKITEMEQQKGENFANARDVRNYFEQIITRQATRISSVAKPSKTAILKIVKEDV